MQEYEKAVCERNYKKVTVLRMKAGEAGRPARQVKAAKKKKTTMSQFLSELGWPMLLPTTGTEDNGENQSIHWARLANPFFLFFFVSRLLENFVTRAEFCLSSFVGLVVVGTEILPGFIYIILLERTLHREALSGKRINNWMRKSFVSVLEKNTFTSWSIIHQVIHNH